MSYEQKLTIPAAEDGRPEQRYRIRLHDSKNVVLFLGAGPEGLMEPIIWGWKNIEEFRQWLEMVKRFDAQLPEDEPEEADLIALLRHAYERLMITEGDARYEANNIALAQKIAQVIGEPVT